MLGIHYIPNPYAQKNLLRRDAITQVGKPGSFKGINLDSVKIDAFGDNAEKLELSHAALSPGKKVPLLLKGERGERVVGMIESCDI